MVAQVTGGDPRVTGMYYDDTWNHDVFPAGTTNCSGPVPGGEAAYEEAIDKDPTRLDAGQGLAGLPGSILQMTSNPLDVINPAALPVDPTTCKPIYPNQYLQVNTIFNVATQHGLRTAWSDKHPAYQMFSGPSGKAVIDYFTPEINSVANTATGGDWTSDNALTMQYDSYKVQAILNEIDGFDHSGKHHVGVPAIFGMNFQTISTAQKLPTSDGLTGGYLPGGTVPGPLLRAGAQLARHRDRRDGVPDQGRRPVRQHRHHHLGQARPVPDRPERPGPGPGLAHHQRDQRRLDGRAPGCGQARHLLHR